MANLHCKREGCEHSGPAATFPQARGGISVYHDFECPECHTTNVDTTELNAAWSADGKDYGYGDNNTLNIRGKNQN